MDDFSDVWIDQCEAARDIRDAWGTRKALGYLLGEKLLNFIRASDADPLWAAKLPLFAAEIQRLFSHDELRSYFATVTHVGAAGLQSGASQGPGDKCRGIGRLFA